MTDIGLFGQGVTVGKNLIGMPYPYGFGKASSSAWATTSLLYDGVDESANAGVIGMVSSATALTFTAWVKPTEVSNSRRIFWTFFNGNRYLAIEKSAGKIKITNRNAGDSANYSTMTTDDTVLASDTWAHIAFVYNGTAAAADRQKLYINGTEVACTIVGTIPTFIFSNAVDTQFGAIGGLWLGNFCEFALYDTALSELQVDLVYNGGTTHDLMLLAFTPEHYYRFDSGAGDDASNVQDIGDTGTNDITLLNFEISDYVADVP